MSVSAIGTIQDGSLHFWRLSNNKMRKDWLLSRTEFSSALQGDTRKDMENRPHFADVSCDFTSLKQTGRSFRYWETTSAELITSCQKKAWSSKRLSGDFIIFQHLACFPSRERKLPEKFSITICFWGKPKSLFKRNGMLLSCSLKHPVCCAKYFYSNLSM